MLPLQRDEHDQPATEEVAPIYVLKPYNLHLSLGDGSTGRVRVFDQQGMEITNGLSYFVGDHSLVAISSTREVTALREETPAEIGTWIKATVDGIAVGNASIVRVLSTDYNIDFVERIGPNSVLFSPIEIEGEDIDQYVEQYEMINVLNYAYEIETDLIDTTPNQGAKQVYEVDFGESEASRVCGASGNPVRLGWNLNGNTWSNCFLVPFIPPRSPQWSVITHELGHNVSWNNHSFRTLLMADQPNYSEAIASYLAIVAMRRVSNVSGGYPVGPEATDSLQLVLNAWRTSIMSRYSTWMNEGASFESVDPDIVDAILLNAQGASPDRFSERFFFIFRPENIGSLIPVFGGSQEGKDTIFAAACSAAARQDLHNLFLSTYHFPLDSDFYFIALAAMESLPFPDIFEDGFESGDTSAWSTSVP